MRTPARDAPRVQDGVFQSVSGAESQGGASKQDGKWDCSQLTDFTQTVSQGQANTEEIPRSSLFGRYLSSAGVKFVTAQEKHKGLPHFIVFEDLSSL